MFLTLNNTNYAASDVNGTALSSLVKPPLQLVFTSKTDAAKAVGRLVDSKFWLYRFQSQDGLMYDLVIRKDGSIWYKNSIHADKTAKVSFSSTHFFKLLAGVSLSEERMPNVSELSTSGVSLDVPQHCLTKEVSIPKWLEPIVDRTKPYQKEWYDRSHTHSSDADQ